MSREKQIEDMAKAIDSEYDCIIPCQECSYYSYKNCRDVKSAEKLYNAGYRKQSEGEWIGEADGYADGELVYDVWYCSECNHCIDDGTDDADLLPNYCPNCGAKMKGV